MRLPFQPLSDAIGVVYHRNPRAARFTGRFDRWGAEETWETSDGAPCTVLAELTGINRRRLVRWVRAGIPEYEADRIAIAIGLHPGSIWPEWWRDEAVSV